MTSFTAVLANLALAVLATAEAWTQAPQLDPPLPIGVDGKALPQVSCSGACPNCVGCCMHALASQTVTDKAVCHGNPWLHAFLRRPVQVGGKFGADLHCDHLERTVVATYGPCACTCANRNDHACGGKWYSKAEWVLSSVKKGIVVEFKDEKGERRAAPVDGPWSNWQLVSHKQTLKNCKCCGPNPEPEPGKAGGLIPGGAIPRRNLILPDPPPKPKKEERPEWPPIGAELKGGMGAARGDDIDSDADFIQRLRLGVSLWDDVWLFIQDEVFDTAIQTESIQLDLVGTQPPIRVQRLVETDEEISVHHVTLGAGYSFLRTADWDLYAQAGIGRYIVSGADGVNGHVTGSLGAGGRWWFLDSMALGLDAGISLGSAKVHAGDAEGTLRGTWGVTVGLEVRF